MDPPQINFVDNNSILIINRHGLMKQVFVPFKVIVAVNISIFRIGNVVYVDEVSQDRQNRLMYRVAGKWWHYDLFVIAVGF
ncbi:hypothetical protein [Polluticoccus soli]|uniref:hypothetical protein n=1 Tax=Polluticoccus soli TaxID=3034150 RepID=UPI0023E24852|nr:hypothetical protein [Flavipsychrobacter sp. JY13-12]